MSVWDCGLVLRHSLAYEAELRRRCLTNREPATKVASDLGLCSKQCQGAVRLLKEVRVSRERLACVVMLDPGLEDEDIAEIFSEPIDWARGVRQQEDLLRLKEPIPTELEYLDDSFCPGDPSPSEVLERAAEIRAARPPEYQTVPKQIKSIHWRAPVQDRPAQRAGSGTQVGGVPAGVGQMRFPWEEAGDSAA